MSAPDLGPAPQGAAPYWAVATISSGGGDGTRRIVTVDVTVGQQKSQLIVKTVDGASGWLDKMANMEKIDERLRNVECDVTMIKERITHMPTTAGLWRAVAVSAGAVIVAMWIVLQFLAKPWAEQLINGVGK